MGTKKREVKASEGKRMYQDSSWGAQSNYGTITPDSERQFTPLSLAPKIAATQKKK
jgi:hypothetical protein